MKMNIYILAFLFLSLTFQVTGQARNYSLEYSVEVLTDSTLKGRRAGTPEAHQAASFLSNQLAALSLDPIGQDYIHSFSFKDISSSSRADIQAAPEKSGQNVVAFLDNKREHTIVIGAHYDHLGEGKHINSRSTSNSPIHYGADDNASGVAVALKLMHELSTNNTREQVNVIVAFFSAEEIGLLGSKAWLNDFHDRVHIDAMINLDMVGRMQDSTIQLFGYGTTTDWEPFINSMGASIQWEIDSSGLGPSDHATFYLDSIPVLHFFTGQHEDYHKETDTPDKLNYRGMRQIEKAILEGILLLDSSYTFNFLKTKDNSQRKRPELKVTMGIMPSYTAGDSGMLIEGVIEGKPAHNAGMEKGDEIISIDTHKVKDIYDYMETLAHYNRGDSVAVQVIRNKKKKTLQLQFN